MTCSAPLALRHRNYDLQSLEGRTLLSADAVLQWNSVALDAVARDFTPDVVAAPDQPGPTATARALAIVQAAVFDAVNALDGTYTPYLYTGRAPRGASVDAAVARAAHDTLVALYPHQEAYFDAALRAARRQIPDGESEDDGLALGRRVARTILQARAGDGADNDPGFENVNDPGAFQTYPGEPAALGAGWGAVTPFCMDDVDHYDAPPPPAIDSPEYAAAYNEVKRLGGDGVTTPTIRTPEQTDIGKFWGYDGTPGLGTPPRFYNQITQTLAKQEHNSLVENARLFALVNLAMADAGIASWDSKYDYDLWRPIRGIRQTDPDGNPLNDRNPLTARDRNWTPLGAPCTNCPPGSVNFTPNFPTYSSGHATFGGALFETLARFYCTDDVSFTITSDEFNGVNRDVDGTVRPLKPRTYSSFSQAMEEDGQSRIYLGIHWSFDKTAGIAQGVKIADDAFDHFLTPVGGNSGSGGDGGSAGPLVCLTGDTSRARSEPTTPAPSPTFTDLLGLGDTDVLDRGSAEPSVFA